MSGLQIKNKSNEIHIDNSILSCDNIWMMIEQTWQRTEL